MIKSRADMDRFLAAQLKKLETDHIDYYLLHALDGASWDNLERLCVLEFLDQAKRDGRIVNAGFSFHGLAGDFTRIVDAYPWVFCQIQYNYLDQTYQAGTAGLEHAAAKGLGVIVMEPLRGGNLGLPAVPASTNARSRSRSRTFLPRSPRNLRTPTCRSGWRRPGRSFRSKPDRGRGDTRAMTM